MWSVGRVVAAKSVSAGGSLPYKNGVGCAEFIIRAARVRSPLPHSDVGEGQGEGLRMGRGASYEDPHPPPSPGEDAGRGGSRLGACCRFPGVSERSAPQPLATLFDPCRGHGARERHPPSPRVRTSSLCEARDPNPEARLPPPVHLGDCTLHGCVVLLGNTRGGWTGRPAGWGRSARWSEWLHTVGVLIACIPRLAVRGRPVSQRDGRSTADVPVHLANYRSTVGRLLPLSRGTRRRTNLLWCCHLCRTQTSNRGHRAVARKGVLSCNE